VSEIDKVSFDEIEQRYREITERIEKAKNGKMKVDAELHTRKRHLREAMDEAKEAGFDPDSLSSEIQKTKEILITKMDLIQNDLDRTEEKLTPMVRSIEGDDA
jgi:chromosome segregation ATPase